MTGSAVRASWSSWSRILLTSEIRGITYTDVPRWPTHGGLPVPTPWPQGRSVLYELMSALLGGHSKKRAELLLNVPPATFRAGSLLLLGIHPWPRRLLEASGQQAAHLWARHVTPVKWMTSSKPVYRITTWAGIQHPAEMVAWLAGSACPVILAGDNGSSPAEREPFAVGSRACLGHF